MQNVLDFSPKMTGYTMMAYPLTMAIVAPLAGWLSDKFGAVLLTTTGLVFNAIGFVSLNLLSTNVTAWVIGLHLAIFGLGQGTFQSPNNSTIMGSVPKAKLGTAGSINALVRNVGMVLGISLSVSLFSYRLHTLSGETFSNSSTAGNVQNFVTALHTVFWAAAIICCIGILLSLKRKPNGQTGS